MFDLLKNYLAILLLLFLPVIAAGQYRFNICTTDNGLPQNTVGGLLQSPDGYIWFTTNDGIVRFDGVRFKVFNKSNTESISSNRFLGSFMDESGVLWFQTELGTLIKFDGGVFNE